MQMVSAFNPLEMLVAVQNCVARRLSDVVLFRERRITMYDSAFQCPELESSPIMSEKTNVMLQRTTKD